VDGQSIADFEADLSNNLYKLWNRLSSGSYFPPPVRRVDIPKDDGRTRPLGIPTVADRVAQMVVKRALEPLVGIDPANRRSMQLAWRDSVAGVTTGCSIWTSNLSSMKSIGSY
jgi:retron-type reverse transcriptase